MSKRVAIWGGYLYQGVTTDESGNNVYLSNSISKSLTKKFNIVNYSMKSLTALKGCYYIKKALQYDSNFDLAIVELGQNEILDYIESDSNLEVSVMAFKGLIEEIIYLFESHNIKVVLNEVSPLVFERLKTNYCLDESKLIKLEEAYKAFNDCLIDFSLEKDLLIISTKKIRKNAKKYVSLDGVSLNKHGQMRFGHKVNKLIQ